jgi:hypothetical protein
MHTSNSQLLFTIITKAEEHLCPPPTFFTRHKYYPYKIEYFSLDVAIHLFMTFS